MFQIKLGVASKFNPLWKNLARTLAEECERCGKPRLYSVFDSYGASGRLRCLGCSTVSRFIRPLIKRVFANTGLDEHAVKNMMEDKLLRKTMLNVTRGIGHFGLRRPQPTAVPVVIVWNYTNRCNLHCIHCHQSSGEADEKELTTDEALAVVDRMGDAGISILTFSGGEPLIRPDLFDVIRRADNAGILCTVASNATLMTKQVVKNLKESGVRRVELGLDGCRAETHDFLRNTRGAFEAALRGIRNCVELGFDEICATMTLHRKNVDELCDTVELAERLGVNRFYLNRLIPAGRGKSVIGLDVTGERRMEALEYIYKKFHGSVVRGEGIQCYSRGMTYYGRLGFERSHGRVFTVNEAFSGYGRMWRDKFGDGISGIVRRYVSGFGGCSAGITYAGLTASGELTPCVPAPIRLGSLLKEDLEELWVNSDLLNYIRRRDQLNGACGSCAYNFICGGCRYTAYVVNGDWLAPDPSCPFGPTLGN